MVEALPLPPADRLRAHVRAALEPLWGGETYLIERLPIPVAAPLEIRGALRLTEVTLPSWAVDHGVDGVLLVPAELVGSWESVDWWTAAFVLLECWHERAWELTHGPVHSYSSRLAEWDDRAWRHAWVNRIARFLGCWANAGEAPRDAHIRVSHDVDAVSKTVPIRLKQGAMRSVVRWRGGRQTTGTNALRFMFGRDDWDCVGDVLALERDRSSPATFHVFADSRRRSPLRWLMDPGYRLDSPRGRALLDTLTASGARIGLHPSFDSWNDPDLLTAQRRTLESHIDRPVRTVRQHWLRFSWADTWAAQEVAGLCHDSTLMFNDRAGFRNSAALTWRPWNHIRSATHSISATPCCFMDSHQYDYNTLTRSDNRVTAASVIDECQRVGGTMEVLWHPHSLSADYGWGPGFVDLLAAVP